MATVWTSLGGVGVAIALTGAVLLVIRLAFQPMRARGPVLRESDREVRARRAEQKALEQTIAELTAQLQRLEAAALVKSAAAQKEAADEPAAEDVAVLSSNVPQASGAQDAGNETEDVQQRDSEPAEAAPASAERDFLISFADRAGLNAPAALRGPASADDSAIYRLPDVRTVRMRDAGGVLPPITDRFASLYELADEGKPAIAIAKSMNMTLGEVELLLSLRRYAMPESPRRPVTIQAS
jgi:hypothetical protein